MLFIEEEVPALLLRVCVKIPVLSVGRAISRQPPSGRLLFFNMNSCWKQAAAKIARPTSRSCETLAVKKGTIVTTSLFRLAGDP